jgi:hypothetical protein
MSNLVTISSVAQFESLLKSSKIVLANCTTKVIYCPRPPPPILILQDFRSGTDSVPPVSASHGTSQAISATFNALAHEFAKDNLIAFAGVDHEQNGDISSKYNVRA